MSFTSRYGYSYFVLLASGVWFISFGLARGGMQEWLNWLPWKGSRGASFSWVRIPLPPPAWLVENPFERIADGILDILVLHDFLPHLLKRFLAGVLQI